MNGLRDALVARLHAFGALRKAAKSLMRGRTVRQSFHGGTICLDAVDHSWAWTGKIRYEGFDLELQERILSLSRDYELLVDIGCNVGAISLSVLLRNPHIRAVCIDPNRRVIELLRRSIQGNDLGKRAEVIWAAVSTDSRGVRFDGTGSVTGHVSAAGETVPSLAFADLIQFRAANKKCLVKVDVEGFETALFGQLNLIRALPNICLFVELHPRGYNDVGDPAACLQLLRRSGATLTELEGKELTSVNPEQFTQVIATWREHQPD